MMQQLLQMPFDSARLLMWGAASILMATVGCGSPAYEVGEVDGVLMLGGKPGHSVRIEFLPDGNANGPPSTAETDADGKFTLRVMTRDGEVLPGAIVGAHRVTLSDLQLAASETGRGVPMRFGSEYTMASSTPLTQDVKSGKQTIGISVP
jgi:hypothetical protein